MEKKQVVLNSIEDLVTLITTSGEYVNRAKWELGDNYENENIDPQTGDRYYRVDYRDESEDPFFHKLNDESLLKRQSQLVYLPCYTFYLRQQGDHGRHGNYILLSQWLGQELEKVWPHNPKYTSLRLNRGFTLLGIAKRLGAAKGLEKQMEQQFAQAKAAEEKRVRNLNRTYAASRMQNFLDGDVRMTVSLVDVEKYIPEPELSALKKALQDAINATTKTIES